MKLYLIILSLLLTSFAVNSATRSTTKLRNKISNQSHKLSVLAAQIKDVDSKIGQNNNEYLDKMRSIEQVEQKVAKMKTELSLSAAQISENYHRARSAFELFLLEKTDDSNENTLQERMIYSELLERNVSSLVEAQSESNRLLENINMYEIEVSKLKRNEEFMYKLIMELEENKKNLSKTYITLLESKNDTQKEYDKLRARKKLVKTKRRKTRKASTAKAEVADFFMSLPLNSFSSVTKSKKGITFKFNENLPITAPMMGKIAYSGELASYGNVIIIDHGKEVRSVFFGDIKTKVKKGGLVQTGDVLGYTDATYGEEKSLYYEIRKKNKVQNTYSWFTPANIKKLRI